MMHKTALFMIFIVHTLASMEEAKKVPVVLHTTDFLDAFGEQDSSCYSSLVAYLHLRDQYALHLTSKQLSKQPWIFNDKLTFDYQQLLNSFGKTAISKSIPLLQQKLHKKPIPLFLTLPFIPKQISCLSSLEKLTLLDNIDTNKINLLAQIKTLKTLRMVPFKEEKIPESFAQLTQLQKLVIEFRFSSPEGLAPIGALSNLRSLALWGGNHAQPDKQLRVLPHEISHLPLLTTLILAGNHMTSAGLQPLAALTQLKKLDLSSNNLYDIPEVIKIMTQLRKLILKDNHLMPCRLDCLNNMPLLEKLDLEGNHVSINFPGDLPCPPNLKELNLSRNTLTRACIKALACLPILNDLKLGSVSWKALPNELATLTNLGRLILKNNELTAGGLVPLGELINLWELDLSYNQIGTIPEAFKFLTRLTRLNLFANVLRGATSAPLGFLNLLDLNLGSNMIGVVPDSFGQLKWLTALNLELNPITVAGAAPLEKLTNLQRIGLTNTKMTIQEIQALIEKLSVLKKVSPYYILNT